MNSASANLVHKSTKKHPKVHLPQPVIARKVIAFQELTSLQNKKSAREASALLKIPNSTMQSWINQKKSTEAPPQLVEFLSTPIGQDFLQRNVMSVMKLMKCGPNGIRGMQEYLRNSGLDHFVASSEGALQKFWERCEEYILSFGERNEESLAAGLKPKKITVCLDEMFRGKRPCLVAIEPVSNYILLEKFTENRTADTWKNEMGPRLKKLCLIIEQVVSDLCGAIRKATLELGAEHSSELFHGQHEICKAVSAPLASQERAAEKALNEAEEKINKINKKPRKLKKEEAKKRKQELKEAIDARDKRRIEFEIRSKRRKKAKNAMKEMSAIHHPINIKTGKLQTATDVESQFNEQFEIIHECSKEAELSESSIGHIEKAQRAFGLMVVYMKWYFVMFNAFMDSLNLTVEERVFFCEVIFPLVYFKTNWRKFSKDEKKNIQEILNNLESKLINIECSEELKTLWMQKAKELVLKFQRSSSCVEGRNGMLSLLYHCFHRLNPRTLKVLTIIHNFDTRRPDGTTAAERLFEAKHENLFESLVANVRIPGKPQKQNHDAKKRHDGWEKRRMG